MIDDADISIVVQGPIIGESSYYITKETTKLVCARLRDLFPKSEIILSGSIGNDVTGIIHDKSISSEDPGGSWFDLDDPNFMNNCNRMIVSTLSGIKASSRKYVLKIRSDLFVLSKSFLEYFYKYQHFNEEYKFVKNRIIAFCIFTVKAHKGPQYTVKRPYHIGDWAYFGYREDMMNLYDIPLTEEPEFSQWFLYRQRGYKEIFPRRLWKMPPEQYVTSCFFKKFIAINFEHNADISNNNEILSEKLIANNFLVLDQNQFSLISLKHLTLQMLFDKYTFDTSIFFHSWLEDYYKYCNVPRDIFWLKQKLFILKQSFNYKIKNRILKILNKKYYFYSWYIARKVKKISLSYKQHIE